MYKKQLIFQKIICFAALIISALVFVYSVGIMTDLYETLGAFVIKPSALNSDDPFDVKHATLVQGSRIVYDMQGFAGEIVVVSIVLILMALTLFITSCQSRRKYYVSNYVSTGLVVVSNIVASIWALVNIFDWKKVYLNTIDFSVGGDYSIQAPLYDVEFVKSTTMFDISIIFFGLLLLATALIVANLIWKIFLMKKENSLLVNSQEVTANA